MCWHLDKEMGSEEWKVHAIGGCGGDMEVHPLQIV